MHVHFDLSYKERPYNFQNGAFTRYHRVERYHPTFTEHSEMYFISSHICEISDIPLLVLNKLVIDSYLSSSHTLPLRTIGSGFSRRQLFVGCITTEPLVVPSRLIIYLKEPLATLTTADISFIPDTSFLPEVLIQIQYPASFTFVVTPQPSYKMPSLGANICFLSVYP